MHQSSLDVLSAVAAPSPECGTIIDRALDAVREHLGMPIAYLSEFVGESTVFRYVSAPGLEHLISPGDSRPLSDVYCRHILSGEMPLLIPDTSTVPLAQDLPITKAAPIGSHASIPIHRADGSIYGMFCCLSPTPNPSLNDRDLTTMGLFAGLAADHLRAQLSDGEERQALREMLLGILEKEAFNHAFQPIYTLADGRLRAFEPLARFHPQPYRSPDLWLQDAARAGLQIETEVRLLEQALRVLAGAPEGTRLSVNASPDTVASGKLMGLFRRAGAKHITLEITEHAEASDFPRLMDAVMALRRLGTKIAIDDVGAGYAGLQRILELKPEILKLDMSLVRDIHVDPIRRALVAALVHFAAETGAEVTGEGVEVPEELAVLRKLGVTYAQGYLLGKPGRIADARPAIVD